MLCLGVWDFPRPLFSQGGRMVMRLTANQFYAGSTPVPESNLWRSFMFKIYAFILFVFGATAGVGYFMSDESRSIGFTNICGEHTYFCTRKKQ